MTQADDVTSQNLALAALVCIVLGAASMAKPDAELATPALQADSAQQLVGADSSPGSTSGQ